MAVRDPKRFLKELDDAVHPDRRRARLLGLEPMPPMQVVLDPGLDGTPHVNVLLPRLGAKSLTGGPNTAIIIACGLAARGVPVRLLALDEVLAADTDALSRHVRALGGTGEGAAIAFGSTCEPSRPPRIGPRDMFMATYWTTAYRLKAVLPRMAVRRFLYLIQDFEPGFYAWSGAYAQALETYGMDFAALVNERLLADHFVAGAVGQFADPAFAARCAVFEPAVDRALFHPVARTRARRRLLFYARPGKPRNLFGIGFEALRAAAADPAFAPEPWDFVSIGDTSLGPMDLGGGRILEPAPWLRLDDYARLMRESDVLLCPMLSPHTSYPVLEMAACGGIAVTNGFGSKTPERLRAISPNILAGPPSIEALRDCLMAAAAAASGPRTAADLDLPSEWPVALRETVRAAETVFRDAARPG